MGFPKLDDGFPKVGWWVSWSWMMGFLKLDFSMRYMTIIPIWEKNFRTKLCGASCLLKKTPTAKIFWESNYDHLVCEKNTRRVFHNACESDVCWRVGAHLAGYYFLDRFGVDNAFVKEWTEEETFCNEVTTTSLKRMLHRVLDMYPASKSFVLAHLG